MGSTVDSYCTLLPEFGAGIYSCGAIPRSVVFVATVYTQAKGRTGQDRTGQERTHRRTITGQVNQTHIDDVVGYYRPPFEGHLPLPLPYLRRPADQKTRNHHTEYSHKGINQRQRRRWDDGINTANYLHTVHSPTIPSFLQLPLPAVYLRLHTGGIVRLFLASIPTSTSTATSIV